MVDRRSRIRIGVFLALLALPLVQLRVRLLPPAPLVGFEKPVQRPPLTAKSWWSGRFQEAFEPWFARRFPVREHLVRTDNQVSLTLFGQAPSGGTPLVLGRGGRSSKRPTWTNTTGHGHRRPRGWRRSRWICAASTSCSRAVGCR